MNLIKPFAGLLLLLSLSLPAHAISLNEAMSALRATVEDHRAKISGKFPQ